jgi:hypothetical protein
MVPQRVTTSNLLVFVPKRWPTSCPLVARVTTNAKSSSKNSIIAMMVGLVESNNVLWNVVGIHP